MMEDLIIAPDQHIEVQPEATTSRQNDEAIDPSSLLLHQAAKKRFYTQHTQHLPSRSLLLFLNNGKTSKAQLVKTYKSLPRTKKNNSQVHSEDHVDSIVSHIKLQEDLMQDDPMSEMRRIEALKGIPECLTVKRSVKDKLNNSINQDSKKKVLSQWKRFRYTTSIFFIKMFITLKDFLSSIELWYSAIKSIEGNFGSGVATYFKFLRWLFLLNCMNCLLSILFIILPQSLVKAYSYDTEFNFGDIFIGKGFLENTILYYGFYSNVSAEYIVGYKYDIPSAYFLTMTCCYLLSFILLSIKVARSYKKCYIETSGGIRNTYATKIFCSWDHNISSSKAASLRSASIYRELKELLAETKSSSNSLFTLKKCSKLFIDFLSVCLVILAITATGMLLWNLLELHKPSREADPSSYLTIPLIVTIIMTVFPLFLSRLAKYENYRSQRNALYVTMIRIYSMAVIVIATLLIYWLSYSTFDCWQTELAQEIYRLIIFDFLIFTIGSFLVEAVHYYIHSSVQKNISAPSFDIALNTLNLIYNQILFWVVFYFSPPLSLIIVVKLFLTFHIKKYGLMRYCEPPSIPWRAAQTQTLFLALSFLGMTGTLTVLGYIFTSVQSNECGPFKNYTYTWEAIVEYVFNIKRDSELWKIITKIARPGVGAAIIVALSMIVYYLRAKAEASKKMVRILREMLVLQTRDKDFLMHEFSKVADENWLQRRTAFNESRISGYDIELS
ncbi:transmembrane channel-like protein 5 [Chelonus insularis]|uniref:transmembrane channel-like protein 5 n=1 Tax=Chelonus insularis TaxID=460826 RepID=UPI00158A41D9|nr:transmembrane channel-like protein 5 [Chelonus insularis]